LTLAAAARGRITRRDEVAVFGGSVHLPGLGTFSFAEDDVFGAAVQSRDGVLTAGPDARERDADIGAWRAVPTLTADGHTVVLDDADPYRDCYETPVETRLAPAAVARWQSRFSEAWHIITTEHADYAPALRAGLSTIVPLTPRPGAETSATARRAFGAIALALPDSADALAMLVIHEFQHVKLGALLDMFDLFDSAVDRHYSVPWRSDERPVEAVLQGLYAHAAVADVWRTRWTRPYAPSEARILAGRRYADLREHVARAADWLLASDALTVLGARLVEAIGERASAWLDEPVPSAVPGKAKSMD
jgi:uncharacterized protein